MINARSLSNQALKSAHPSLFSSRCWPWVSIDAGQPLQHGEVRDTHLAWVRPVIGTNIGVLLIEVLVKVGSFDLCGNSLLSFCTFFRRMRSIARLEMRPTTVGHHVRHSITISFRYLWLMCSAILHNISGNSGGLRPASYSTRVFIFTFIMQLLTFINTLVLIYRCVCWRIKIPQSKFKLHASYTIRHKIRHNDNSLVLIFTPATSRMRCICCLWLTPWPT